MSMLQKLLTKSPKLMIKFMTALPEKFWVKKSNEVAISVFQKTYQAIPAYKKHLQMHGIDSPSDIITIDQFAKRVPVTSKKDYLRQYPLEDLSSEQMTDSFTITLSSGSTGDPMYYCVPINTALLFPPGMMAFFDYYWGVNQPNKKVLWVNALSLGMWMGSVYANFIFQTLCLKNKNYTMISPGTDVERVLDCVDKFSESYDLTIIFTYPSFIKTMMDMGDAMGLDWKKYNIRFASSGEMLDFTLREHVTNKICDVPNQLTCFFDAYGGTEIGNPGIATPEAVAIRKATMTDAGLSEDIYGTNKTGTIFQINPMASYTEIIDGQIVITKDSSIPVVRYNVKDTGKIIGYSEMHALLTKNNIDINSIYKKYSWNKANFSWPFLVFTGRQDWAVAFFGTKIAPESLLPLFTKNKIVRTFRFDSKDKRGKERFVIYIETHPNVKLTAIEKKKLQKEYHDSILNYLLKTNPDFVHCYSAEPKITDPIIILYSYNSGPFSGQATKKANLTQI